MEEIKTIMKKYGSFSQFDKSPEYCNPTDSQLLAWHKELKDMPRTTRRERLFINGFYRKYAERLGLEKMDYVDDARYRAPRIVYLRVFCVVMLTLLVAGVIVGSRRGICNSMVKTFGLKCHSESLRTKFCSLVVIDEDLLRVINVLIDRLEIKKTEKAIHESDQ
ncbi:hypothetical protein [Parabacteroides sp. PF5-6]|uniref:hypothetical protein n=1 Tax=Parabacteroides sp. PF5-6 TaxID=1742403 RepID=UPI002405D72C|nr:hypothetical protein [Parabacteroides sp. PF5-6]MDF9830846.1 hypothetical protein [Parabacteroides sp. PF5-6]